MEKIFLREKFQVIWMIHVKIKIMRGTEHSNNCYRQVSQKKMLKLVGEIVKRNGIFAWPHIISSRIY